MNSSTHIVRLVCRAVAIITFVVLSSCASTGHRPGDVSQETARKIYVEGMHDLVDGSYEAALVRFRKLAQNFPLYMTYTKLAKLCLADTLFQDERHLEAVEVYQEFASLYPQDPNVSYARYMAARALAARIPSDVTFFSPAIRLDMSRVLQARDALKAFLKSNPESTYSLEAALLLRDIRARLYAHHRYVASFYNERSIPKGTLNRLAEMYRGYPEWAASRGNLNRVLELAEETELGAQVSDIQDAFKKRFPKPMDSSDPAEESLQ
jgi:outer membrane assembly lipoprotein YfiO